MNIENIEDPEDTPTVIGRCHNAESHSGCGYRIMSDDLDAIPLGPDRHGKDIGMICGPCLRTLFSTASWSSHLNVGHPRNQEMYREPRRADSFAGGKKRKKANSGGFHLPGSPIFKDKKDAQGQQWRNYPDGQ